MIRDVFLTGATGYVGRHILKGLLFEGLNVSCLVRSARAAASLKQQGVDVIVGDLQQASDWIDVAVKGDAFIHGAFPYDDNGQELDAVERSFVDTVLSAVQSHCGRTHVIYTSSLFQFGAVGPANPFAENNAPPLDPSGWCLGAERDILALNEKAHRSTVIRLGWVYSETGGTLRASVAALPADIGTLGVRHVPLVHIEDVADLYLLALRKRIGGILHACEQIPVRWSEVLQKFPVGRFRTGQNVLPVDRGIFAHDRPALPTRSFEHGWAPRHEFTRDFAVPDFGSSQGFDQ